MKVRRATVAVSSGLFTAITARPGELIQLEKTDIPADARIINAAYDWDRDQLIICLESESFPETEMGNVLPRLQGPWFRTMRPSAELLEAVYKDVGCTPPYHPNVEDPAPAPPQPRFSQANENPVSPESRAAYLKARYGWED